MYRKPTLGLALVVFNERKHLPASISQFYPVVDDIVVVDGGSSDGSVVEAENLGARVFHRPFDRNFSAQKNYALEMLGTDWIYLHDPDERLEPTFVDIIPDLMFVDGQKRLAQRGIIPEAAEAFDCYGVPRKNYIDGLLTGVYPDYQYRLFKNYCRYKGRVRETIVDFRNRTEIDFKKNSLQNMSRFNLLHYKSSKKQKGHDALYESIEREAGKDA